MDVHYFEPISIFYLVLALLILYPILFIILLISSKVNLLGKFLYGISAILYAYVIWYSYGLGVYLDELEYNAANETVIFGNFGYFHLILLAFPYIFLLFGFSSKDKRLNN